MTLMQGEDLSLWAWTTLIITVLGIVCIWYGVISGRDRSPRKLRKQERVFQFGEMEDNDAPLTKFLIWTYVLVGFFSIGYLIWTGMNGLKF